jgi:hypothetical protein
MISFPFTADRNLLLIPLHVQEADRDEEDVE